MLNEKYIANRIEELCEKRPDLTEKQRHVLDVWDSLSQREKEAVTIYVKGIKLE